MHKHRAIVDNDVLCNSNFLREQNLNVPSQKKKKKEICQDRRVNELYRGNPFTMYTDIKLSHCTTNDHTLNILQFYLSVILQ